MKPCQVNQLQESRITLSDVLCFADALSETILYHQSYDVNGKGYTNWLTVLAADQVAVSRKG